MFHLYLNNYREVRFFPILATACGITFYSLLIFIIGTFIFRELNCSLLLAGLLTLALFVYRPYCKMMYVFMAHGITISYLALLGIAVCILYRYRKEISRHMTPAKLLPIWFAFMCLTGIETWRVIPIASQPPENLFSSKWSPAADKNLPQPDIYWIHCDGMLSFSAFYKYYRDEQLRFREILLKNGFMINDDAEFECGHATQFAIPVLMCPNLYDHCLAPYFSTKSSAEEFLKKQHIYAVSLAWFRLHDNELYMAFEKRGYDILIVPDVPNYFLYNFRGKNLDADEIFNFCHLTDFYDEIFDRLSVFFLFFIQNREKRIDKVFRNNGNEQDLGTECKFKSMSYNYDLIKCLEQTLKQQSPKLVVINQDRTHAPFLFDENGKCHNGKGYISETDPAAYSAQHHFAVKELCGLVSKILRHDPNAVIVIQGDHGLHCTKPEEFQFRFGQNYRQEEVWNAVISAVRIPKKFRTGDEHLMQESPLNISRYLIKHYVGSNNCHYRSKQK